MKMIPLTRGKVALVDDADYSDLMQWNWQALCCRNKPYKAYAVRCRRVSDGLGPKTILMHRVLLAAPDGLEGDHINGNGLDNQRANLRLASRSLNAQNNHRRKNKKSKLPLGVTKHRDKFQARIGRDSAQWLGVFSSPDEAHEAYLSARQKRMAQETGETEEVGR